MSFCFPIVRQRIARNAKIGSMTTVITINGCSVNTGPLTLTMFSMDPNPAWNNIVLEGQGIDFKNYEFEIVDIAGRVYNNLDLNIRKQTNRVDIGLEKLSMGSYVMLVTGDRKIWQLMFQKR